MSVHRPESKYFETDPSKRRKNLNLVKTGKRKSITREAVIFSPLNVFWGEYFKQTWPLF